MLHKAANTARARGDVGVAEDLYLQAASVYHTMVRPPSPGGSTRALARGRMHTRMLFITSHVSRIVMDCSDASGRCSCTSCSRFAPDIVYSEGSPPRTPKWTQPAAKTLSEQMCM